MKLHIKYSQMKGSIYDRLRLLYRVAFFLRQ